MKYGTILAMAKKLTTAEFIEKARRVHDDKYDYHLVSYINAHTKIVVICPSHGQFIQEPTNHIHIGQGCPTCGRGGTDIERFWNFVSKDGPTVGYVLGRCWKWLGDVRDNGYGRFWVNGGSVPAHRYSYEMHNSSVPDGMFVLHQCDNPECVNPDHLFVGTAFDNMRDMSTKGRARDQRGEKNNMSKLTIGDVRKMRQMYRSGNYIQRQLADEFRIALSTANQIVNRKAWSWLDD